MLLRGKKFSKRSFQFIQGEPSKSIHLQIHFYLTNTDKHYFCPSSRALDLFESSFQAPQCKSAQAAETRSHQPLRLRLCEYVKAQGLTEVSHNVLRMLILRITRLCCMFKLAVSLTAGHFMAEDTAGRLQHSD